MAIVDAAIGTLLCIYSLIMDPWAVTTHTAGFNGVSFNMRLELLLLIPYLVKMLRIRKEWEENRYDNTRIPTAE